MDPEKDSAGLNWPVLTDHKQLQRFLGFANFYRRFIRNHRALAAPMHALTSSNVKFFGTSEADQAFQVLRRRFWSAPILHMSDSELQFILEVDASNVGIGAVLSQRSPVDKKIHQCAYFSNKLGTVGNYLL